MYTLSIPVHLTEHFRKEETCEELKRAGAHRVFLAVSLLSFDRAKNRAMLEQLRELVPYFQERNIETGVWFWTFWRSDIDGKTEDRLMVTSAGQKRITATLHNSSRKTYTGYCCPAHPGFVADTVELIRQIAEIGPDILLCFRRKTLSRCISLRKRKRSAFSGLCL